MDLKKIKIRNNEVMPFTIPSGIITTEPSCLERLAKEIPELGILTTKSIGPQARQGNIEPILAQYIPGGFINAVGLTNPGAEEFARKLSTIRFPEDKFLLASIFGKDAAEFLQVAKTLEGYVDGFELNLSCPHAKGYGMQLGQDKDLVGKITKAVVDSTKKPVFAKLTPNAGNIGEISKSAIAAGAYGISAINTVGPGYYSFEGFPILSNKVGGLSGIGILPIGLKCVRDIREAIGKGIPIIGMGGIRNAADVEAYMSAGADIFGIGSALIGMKENEIERYFWNLTRDIEDGRNHAESLLKKVDMNYQKAYVDKRIDLACDFKVIKTDKYMDAKAGQFIFAWIPGIGEKPFSIMDDDPLTLGVLSRGAFTKEFNSLKQGDPFYIRGPYGQGIEAPADSNVVLVGGGCGIAGIYLLAKKFSGKSRVTTLLAAKDKEHIPYLKEFENYSQVHIATEDGSLGKKGLVTSLISGNCLNQESYFFNCGSRKMLDAILPLELSISSPDRIYSSLDYMTKCGVGICGSCADDKGKRTCVDGPFMNESK